MFSIKFFIISQKLSHTHIYNSLTHTYLLKNGEPLLILNDEVLERTGRLFSLNFD